MCNSRCHDGTQPVLASMTECRAPSVVSKSEHAWIYKTETNESTRMGYSRLQSTLSLFEQKHTGTVGGRAPFSMYRSAFLNLDSSGWRPMMKRDPGPCVQVWSQCCRTVLEERRWIFHSSRWGELTKVFNKTIWFSMMWHLNHQGCARLLQRLWRIWPRHCGNWWMLALQVDVVPVHPRLQYNYLWCVSSVDRYT